MAHGAAQRWHIGNVGELAAVIEGMRSNQAIALGALRANLPDEVQVVTKKNLNGQARTIARTAADINYRKGVPALALLDFDAKGMPEEVASEMKRLGGFWPTLLSVLPELQSVAYLLRRSTSAGLFRADTGEALSGSRGLHVYVPVEDGADVERFLRALHDRCWLVGFGWMMVGAGGQMLERSIVDRMVGAPERLIFEGDPILDPPLAQDRESRRPTTNEGATLDTVAACPPLTIVETAKVRTLKTKAKRDLAPKSVRVRAAFVETQAQRIAQRAGISIEAAKEQVARQCDGVLLPDVELPFDDEEFARCTVADVLADPARFEGATLADPLEGVAYGICKARVMRRVDGTPWIHSFAHGRIVYELKHNATTVRAAMQTATDVVKVLVKLAAAAEIDAGELEELRDEASKRSGVAKRTITKMLRDAERKLLNQRRREEHERRLAEDDPRPTVLSPNDDAPWLPYMGVLNDAVGSSTARHPVERDIDGVVASTGKVVVPATHAFTSDSVNPKEK
jgi:hypothetical protein